MKESKSEGIFAQYHYEDGRVVGHSSDGTGSKLIFDLRYGNLDNAARNLVAMNLDDLACEYIKPSHFWDSIAMTKENGKLKEDMILCLRRVLSMYDVELAGGETAILPYQLSEGSVIWDGYIYGSDDGERHRFYMGRRRSLEEGLTLCAIPDEGGGLGSNGFTFLHSFPFRDEFVVPCRIYTSQMLCARDDVWFFAHITGGGYKNVGRVLPRNLDAIIELKHFPDIFKYIQDRIGFSDKKMFEIYHMGNRLVVGTKNVRKVINIFENAFVIGELKKGDGKVMVNGIKLNPY